MIIFKEGAFYNSFQWGPHASSNVLSFTVIGYNTINIPKIVHVFTVFIVDINYTHTRYLSL